MKQPKSADTVWSEMRQRLAQLTVADLKQIARDEGITLGYAASRKDTLVGAIVAERGQRADKTQEDPGTHPWRRWGSLQKMPVKFGLYE